MALIDPKIFLERMRSALLPVQREVAHGMKAAKETPFTSTRSIRMGSLLGLPIFTDPSIPAGEVYLVGEHAGNHRLFVSDKPGEIQKVIAEIKGEVVAKPAKLIHVRDKSMLPTVAMDLATDAMPNMSQRKYPNQPMQIGQASIANLGPEIQYGPGRLNQGQSPSMTSQAEQQYREMIDRMASTQEVDTSPLPSTVRVNHGKRDLRDAIQLSERHISQITTCLDKLRALTQDGDFNFSMQVMRGQRLIHSIGARDEKDPNPAVADRARQAREMAMGMSIMHIMDAIRHHMEEVGKLGVLRVDGLEKLFAAAEAGEPLLDLIPTEVIVSEDIRTGTQVVELSTSVVSID